MQITVSKANTVIYSQTLDDSKTLNSVIGHLMQQPSGTEMVTVVNNNGHDMKFSNAAFDINPLVRKVNGILMREAKAKVA